MTPPMTHHSEPAREAVADAMRKRRHELINEPLARIWPQLADAALPVSHAAVRKHWRCERWQDGSSPVGKTNILCDDLEVVIAADIPDYAAADIVREHNAALASPAATSAETQGRDGVREAVAICEQQALQYLNGEPSTAIGRMYQKARRDCAEAITAALAPSTSAAIACNLVPPPETYGGSADEPWTGRMPSTSAATRGEPVAYLHRNGATRVLVDASRRLDDEDRALGWVETPLYDHPAPAARTKP